MRICLWKVTSENVFVFFQSIFSGNGINKYIRFERKFELFESTLSHDCIKLSGNLNCLLNSLLILYFCQPSLSLSLSLSISLKIQFSIFLYTFSYTLFPFSHPNIIFYGLEERAKTRKSFPTLRLFLKENFSLVLS